MIAWFSKKENKGGAGVKDEKIPEEKNEDNLERIFMEKERQRDLSDAAARGDAGKGPEFAVIEEGSETEPPKVSEKPVREYTYEEAFIGWQFEQFIKNMFDTGRFRLIYEAPEPTPDEMPRFLYEQYLLALEFEEISTKERFFVECKYRSKWNGRTLEWTDAEQFEKYKENRIYSRKRTFIAFGLEGVPFAPETISIIDLDRIIYTDIYPSYLKRHKVESTATFRSLEELLRRR